MEYDEIRDNDEVELLSLQSLFFHKGLSDDTLYFAGKEDGVCGGENIALAMTLNIAREDENIDRLR